MNNKKVTSFLGSALMFSVFIGVFDVLFGSQPSAAMAIGHALYMGVVFAAGIYLIERAEHNKKIRDFSSWLDKKLARRKKDK